MTRGYSDETQQGYTMDTVMEEAQRCLLCLDAPCSAACPAGTDPARFIRSVRFRLNILSLCQKNFGPFAWRANIGFL